MCVICEAKGDFESLDFPVVICVDCPKIEHLPALRAVTVTCVNCPNLASISLSRWTIRLTLKRCRALKLVPPSTLTDLDMFECGSIVAIGSQPELRVLSCQYGWALRSLPQAPRLMGLMLIQCPFVEYIPFYDRDLGFASRHVGLAGTSPLYPADIRDRRPFVWRIRRRAFLAKKRIGCKRVASRLALDSVLLPPLIAIVDAYAY